MTALYYYHTPPRPVPTLPKPHHPLLAPSHLPPLLKVRCCRPKKFGRLPEGLHNNPSPRITLQNRTIPCFAPPHLPPLSKVRCCRPKKFGRLPEGLPHHHPSLAPTLPKPHYPPPLAFRRGGARSSRCIDPLHFYNLLKSTSIASPCTTTLAALVKGEVLSPEKIRATTGGIASPPSLACTNPSKTALSPSLFVG